MLSLVVKADMSESTVCVNGDTRMVRGAEDAGDSGADDEENETRNVGGMG